MASSVTKKKEEEQNLKILRQLTSIEYNKKCLECSQRGITYADMTTTGFVCVQCSGFLRGLNPPHRVKSISMTTFSQSEIEALKKGGNEVARKVWQGKWNTKRDRVPDRSDEAAFKSFLVSKYERRSWYVDPKEAIKQEERTTPKPEPKLAPPPSAIPRATPPLERPRGGSQPRVTTPPPSAAATAPPSVATASKKVDLLGDLQGDPFASKAPVGGVSVLPAGGFKPDDFGAFTGASQPPTPVVSTSLTAPPPSTALSAGDKYAALASLDNTFRDLKVPPQQPSPVPVPKNQSQPFGSTSAVNPFGTTPSGPVQSNPFTGQQQGMQQSTGGQQQQQQQQPFGGSQPQQQGQAFGQPQAFGNQQAVFQGGQGFAGQQPQQFGAFGQQQMPPGHPYGGGQPNPYGQQQQQQWGQQQGAQQGPPGSSFGSAAPQGQQQWSGQAPRAAQPPRQQGGFPPQPQAGFAPQQQGGFGAAPRQQGGFAPQQQQQGGFASRQQGGFGTVPQQQRFASPQQGQGGFPQSGFAGQQQSQQGGFGTPPSSSFGGVSQQQQSGAFGGQKTQPASFNQPQWNSTTTQARTVNNTAATSATSWSSSVAVTTASQPTSNAGWSSGLSKPAPLSTWGFEQQPAQSTSSTGDANWSTGLVSGQQGGAGWSGADFGSQANFGGAGTPQQQQQTGFQQGSANPFAASSQQSTTTNPFL